MGPLATGDLFTKIVKLTKAENDQQHLRILVDNNTNIPDRTAAILSGGADPVEQMCASAAILTQAGAEVLCMPCNTAHYFYERVIEKAGLGEKAVFVNMLRETAAFAKSLGYKKVGLLATDGTIGSGVYEKAFKAQGIDVVVPGGKDQQAVMDIIYKGVKAGNLNIDTTAFVRTMDALIAAGAETLVLGCTELPLAFQLYGFTHSSIDPTRLLALAVIREAGAESNI